MFTGLVADLGTVAEVDSTNDGVRLAIESPLARELSEGDSVAVNGVCLTAVGLCGDRFGADVMHETLRRSSLAELRAGTPRQPRARAGANARLGGHIVQGHVDGVGARRRVREDGFARVVTIEAEPELLRYVVEKGSITVDGVSLTVARIDDASFDVSLIPETLERTNLGAAEPGTPVNLEVDIVAKYVEKLADDLTAPRRHRSPPSRRRWRTSPPGKMVVVVDDEDRENEGDLVMAAEFVTRRRHQLHGPPGRRLDLPGADAGALRRARARADGAKNESAHETPFTVTIEAREGVTTGISVRRPGAHDARRGRPGRRARRTSSSPATSTR